MTAGIEVDFARKQDVPALARVLGRAFFDDPVMEWMQPHDKRRARALPRMFAAMVRHHFLAGEGVEVARRVGEMGGAALWDPPGRWKQTQAEELRILAAGRVPPAEPCHLLEARIGMKVRDGRQDLRRPNLAVGAAAVGREHLKGLVELRQLRGRKGERLGRDERSFRC